MKKEIEAKVRSIRATDDTFEKFKSITEEFANSNEALSSLIKTWELQQARAVLTDRDMDVNDFNSHIQSLQEAYLHSLELNENAEQRIRQEFETLLKSKDETIRTLQERATTAEGLQKDAENLKQNAEKELKQAQEAITALEEKINDAEQIAEQLKDSITEKERTIKLMYEQLAECGAKITALEGLKDVEKQLEDVKKQLEAEQAESARAALTAEVITNKRVLEARQEMQGKIESLSNELQEARREIRMLEQEIYELKINAIHNVVNSISSDEEYPDFDDGEDI